MREHHKIQKALELLKEASEDKQSELKHLVSDLYGKVKDYEDMAVDKVKTTANSVNKSVHTSPWQYIGGAALGGFILGFILRNRR